MAITHITDHYALAVERLPQQFKAATRYLGWVRVYTDKIQQIEDVAWEIYFGKLLSQAPTGDLLRKIGALVGQTSMGYGDDVFLLLIQARIPTNRSKGRKRDMVRIAKALNESPPVTAFTLPQATFYLQPSGTGTLTVSPYVQREFYAAAIGAGVRLVYVWSPTQDTGTITWGSAYGYAPGATQSPGSVYSTAVSGKWAGAI